VTAHTPVSDLHIASSDSEKKVHCRVTVDLEKSWLQPPLSLFAHVCELHSGGATFAPSDVAVRWTPVDSEQSSLEARCEDVAKS